MRKSGEPNEETSRKAVAGNPNQNLNLDLEKLEKAWAREYHNKPNDERERVMNELHGVSSREVPESPEMVAYALDMLQKEIDNVVPEYEKGAYYVARSINSTYVKSVPFRLKFLRATLFDTNKAALRYVRNLDYLLEKFGEFALMRQLYLSDLNKEERKFLKMGYMQILPFRDNVGRRIIVNLGSYGGREFSMLTKERVGAYLQFAILAEDETTQRKGAISIGMLNDDAIESIQGVEVSSILRYIRALPFRYTGMHTCFADNIRSRIIKALAMTFIHKSFWLLSRFHIGTQIECEYKLRTFGIPTECIPLSCTGMIKVGNHKSYLKMRSKIDDHRRKEAGDDYRRYYSSSFAIIPFPAIECPEVDSFLVRRNGVAWNYSGNIRVRALLEEKLSDRKRLRDDYVSSITEELIARNISILAFDDLHCWYTKVTRKEDIQKQVLYIMREIRKRNRVKEQQMFLQSNVVATDTFKGMTDGQYTEIESCFCVPISGTHSMDVKMKEEDSEESQSSAYDPQ